MTTASLIWVENNIGEIHGPYKVGSMIIQEPFRKWFPVEDREGNPVAVFAVHTDAALYARLLNEKPA